MTRSLPAAALLALVPALALAGEGMWLPGQIGRQAARLAGEGLAIDAAALDDPAGLPLGAVVNVGGCSGSFVSSGGLVVTNHHCVTGILQYNSTPDRNLLRDGYLAATLADELPGGPGTRILVPLALDDVTSRVLEGIPSELAGSARHDAIEVRTKAIVAECEAEPGRRCSVEPLFGGLRYLLSRRLEIRDVRLVHAPPESVGNFGGDVDNWIWPRHTGDFAFLRAWVGPDGEPAAPASENVPYVPARRLAIGEAGVAPGDLVMVAGYPARTNRHRLASEVEQALGRRTPERKRLYEAMLAEIERETAGRPDARIRYASAIDRLNNATKNYAGLLAGYARSDVLARKRAAEANLSAWIAGDPERTARWGGVVERLESLVASAQAHEGRDLLYGDLVRRGALFETARTIRRLAGERSKPDAEREPGFQQRDLPRIRDRMEGLDRRFDPAVDRAIWRRMLLEYAKLPAAERVAPFDRFFAFGPGAVDPERLDAKLASIYGATRLGDEATRLSWLDAPLEAVEKSDDPLLRLASAVADADLALEREEEDRDARLDAARARWMEAVIAWRDSQGADVYPDADGTLRVTFGRVGGYAPRDGLEALAFTTVEGILEKETGVAPFDSPPALLEAIRARRFGSRAVPALGSVPVDFLSDVDTTGGNSGSPTLDARGRLVGLLFDGVWESILADWDFDPRSNRSIHVDIRYVLWWLEQQPGAGPLLEEMGVGRGAPG